MKLAGSAYGPQAPTRPAHGFSAKRPRSSISKSGTESKQTSFLSSRGSLGSSQRTSKTMGVSTKLVKPTSRGNEDLSSKARTSGQKVKSSPQILQLVPNRSCMPQKSCLPDGFEIRSTSKVVGGVAHKTASLGQHAAPVDVAAQDIDHKDKLSLDKEGLHIQQHG